MKTIDISGMGGGYENECQKMLWAGVQFLKKEPGPLKYKESPQIFGIIDTSSDDLTARLEQHIVKNSDGCTGAMVHAVMGHLFFIAQNSVDAWLAEFKDQPDRYFEWDGTAKSCPETDLSKEMDKK